jgi:radical SAM superfamily enzyme YgiQ (UPF0313 family)
MKILLIASNRLEEPLPAFPLGVAYLAGNIDTKAHSVEVLDLMFEENYKELVTSTVRRTTPDIIGISIRNVNAGGFNPLPGVAEIAGICRKESDARIVLGGTGFTMMPKEIFTHFDADLGVVGEGVVSFNRLLERLDAGKGWDNLPGLVWKDDGVVRINESSKDEAPDDFKAPARMLFDCQKYSEKAWFSANILVQRGSPFQCLWDDTPRQEGTRIRSRAPRNVVDELEMLAKDFGFKSATLIAPKFNYPEDYTKELCEEMIARDLGLSWMTDIHVYPSSPDLFSLMKRAGCILAFMDVGTCAETTLKRIDVDFGLEDIRKCCADMRSAELNYGFLMFFGGPGETKETVEESLAFVEETDPLMVGGEIGMRIYPNTPLAELAMKEGMISESQDLYEPAFYTSKEVEDWLHERLAKVAEERSGFAF